MCVKANRAVQNTLMCVIYISIFFISMTNRKLAVMYADRCTPSNSIHIARTSIRLVCAVLSCVCYIVRYEMGDYYTVGRRRPDMWIVVVCLRSVHKTAESDY